MSAEKVDAGPFQSAWQFTFVDGLIVLLESLVLSMQLSITPLRFSRPLTDSSVFRYVAFEMTQGRMPYLDTFDHKGPLLYIINYAGMKLSFWRGLWPIEFLVLLLAVVFFFKTARLLTNRVLAHLVTLIAVVSVFMHLEGGNLTEEYALPFISYSMYALLDYYLNKKTTWLRVLLCGSCFGAVLLLRPNMIAVWAVFCLAICFRCIADREFNDLLSFFIYFALGCILLMAPIMIWIKSKGAMSAFLDTYIGFNSRYSQGSSGFLETNITRLNAFRTFLDNPITTTALLSIPFGLVCKRDGVTVISIYFLLSVFLCSISGYVFAHYGITIVPAEVCCLAMLAGKDAFVIAPSEKAVHSGSTFSRYRTAIGASIAKLIPLCALAYLVLASAAPSFASMYTMALAQLDENQSIVFDGEIGEAIDLVRQCTEPEDYITVCSNVDVIYLATGCQSASRYSYQTVGELDESIVDSYFAELEEQIPVAVVLPDSFFAEQRMNDFLSAHQFVEIGQTSDGWATVWSSQ